MLFIVGGVGWFGYQTLTYGWSQVRGCNAGFWDIAWPGRYKGCNPDGAGTSTTTGEASTSNNQFGTGSGGKPVGPDTTVNLGNGRTVRAGQLPGGPGNPASP